MARGSRLLALLDALHRRRAPVSGAVLAEELGVSLRTLYRDVATLQEEGAQIEGEAGVGYVLRPGWLLPPLSFPEAELEALALGLRWVAERGDPRLASAARQALGRIGAVLPADRRAALADDLHLLGPAPGPPEPAVPTLREAIRAERRLRLLYRDATDAPTERTVWPIALAFFERVRILVAWCELRQGFRHFRVDRMASIEVLPEPYPARRRQLLKDWRVSEGIDRQ